MESLPTDKLNQLSYQQLKQIKRALQKFFYANGTNIALHEALGKKESKSFKKKVRKALYKQILHVAEVDKISKITQKKIKKIEDETLMLLVGVYWLTFSKALDGGTKTALAFLLWAGNQGGKAALDKMIPPPHVFELKNKVIKAKLEDRIGFLTDVLDKTGIRWTAEIIEQGLKNDLSNVEIVKFLRREANRVALQRADVITETELLTAMNVVEMEAFLGNGIEKHRWIVTLDERTCILGGRTRINTLNGYKEIRNIEIGDYVLTHKDRYREVTNTFKRKYFGNVVRIKLPLLFKKHNILLTVTEDHLILTNNNGKQRWVKAKDLNIGDNVCIEGKRCECDKIIPFSKKTCYSCRIKKLQEAALAKSKTPEGRKKIIETNKKYNKAKLMRKAYLIARKNNPQKYKKIAKKQGETLKNKYLADKAFRQKRILINRKTAQYSTHPFRQMSREKRIENNKKARISLGKNHRGQSYLERKMNWFLTKEKINFIPQWFFRYKDKEKEKYGWMDFYLPQIKTIIECDGYFHSKPEVEYKDKIKTEHFRKQGINILRFNEDEIRNQFEKVASKIKQLCCIATIPIKELKKWHLKPRKREKPHQIVYNLEVEEDQSYTANGIVVHNCDICLANESAGPIPVGDIFPSGTVSPPSHPRCRCFLAPTLPVAIEGKLWTGK